LINVHILYFVVLAAIGFPLLTDSGNWRMATYLIELQQETLFLLLVSIAASLFPLSADWLPAISYLQWAPPLKMDKPHILASAAETSFLQFKEQVPLKFKNKMSAFQFEWKTSRLI
jgi:hypothetical protein